MKYTDQTGREVILEGIPKRIISLVPSQTELLYDLGLEDELVGVTKFCVHPVAAKQKAQIIGGTKNFRFETIDALKPDLIIGNKEENYQSGIEQLAEKYPVWLSDIYDLNDALKMISQVGQLVGKVNEAMTMSEQIKRGFDHLPKRRLGSAAYLIWNDPIMAVGSQTFIDDMLKRVGFENAVTQSRYPELSLETLEKLQPDYLLLSSEPFPFQDKHILFFKEHLPNTHVEIVDGEMFSWYGSRLFKSLAYFHKF